MRINPGGTIPVGDVVGRGQLVKELWRVVERQSVVLAAERRIGKTTVLRKMRDESPDWANVVFVDLEAVQSTEGFSRKMYQELKPHVGRLERLGIDVRNFFSSFKGAGAAGVKLPEADKHRWKELLRKVFESFEKGGNGKLILMLDELPWMLEKIYVKNGPEEAMDLLDFLRESRQQREESLRLIYTGSIGLHHILGKLKKDGHGGTPINDMCLVEVPVLEQGDALALVEGLVEGENISCSEPNAKEQLAISCDCFPFYIHHAMDEFVKTGQTLTRQTVGEVVTRLIENEGSPFQLQHYHERLGIYYPDEQIKVVAQKVLTILSTESSMGRADLSNQVNSEGVFEDYFIREVLGLLVKDHYLLHEAGQYKYKFDLVKSWWAWRFGA